MRTWTTSATNELSVEVVRRLVGVVLVDASMHPALARGFLGVFRIDGFEHAVHRPAVGAVDVRVAGRAVEVAGHDDVVGRETHERVAVGQGERLGAAPRQLQERAALAGRLKVSRTHVRSLFEDIARCAFCFFARSAIATESVRGFHGPLLSVREIAIAENLSIGEKLDGLPDGFAAVAERYVEASLEFGKGVFHARVHRSGR